MSYRAMFAGVAGKAKRIRSGYVGVDGVAKRIKAGFVGVNGLAQRFCWFFDKAEGIPSDAARICVGQNGKGNCFLANSSGALIVYTYSWNGVLESRNLGYGYGRYSYFYGQPRFSVEKVEGSLNLAIVGDGTKDESTYSPTGSLMSYSTEGGSFFRFYTLSTPRNSMLNSRVGSYALFAGGMLEGKDIHTASTIYNYVFSVNTSFTVSSLPSGSRLPHVAAKDGDVSCRTTSKALFLTADFSNSRRDLASYNSNLVRTVTKNVFPWTPGIHFSLNRGDFALFGQSYSASLSVINDSLVKLSDITIPNCDSNGFHYDSPPRASGNSVSLIESWKNGVGTSLMYKIDDNLVVTPGPNLDYGTPEYDIIDGESAYFNSTFCFPLYKSSVGGYTNIIKESELI